MRIGRFVLAMSLLALAASPASATLFFSQDSNGSGLYTLNTSTGAATLVAPGTTGVTSMTVGLAPHPNPGQLYGTTWTQTVNINQDGSGFSLVGNADAEGLAYDSSANVLYGAINGSFFTINQVTAAKTPLAGPGGDVEGLAYDHAGGIFGLADGGILRRYNIGTNSWAVIGNTGVGFDQIGLAYDPGANILYAKGNQDSFLYSINPATAAAARIGDTGIAAGGGLAFISVALPEPATALLGIFGVAGLALRRRRTA